MIARVFLSFLTAFLRMYVRPKGTYQSARGRAPGRLAGFLGLERNTGVVALTMFTMALGEHLWRKFLPKYLEALGAPLPTYLACLVQATLGGAHPCACAPNARTRRSRTTPPADQGPRATRHTRRLIDGVRIRCILHE